MKTALSDTTLTSLSVKNPSISSTSIYFINEQEYLPIDMAFVFITEVEESLSFFGSIYSKF